MVEQAIRNLDGQGWTQGTCRDENGICMGTALWEAAGIRVGEAPSPGQAGAWASLSALAVDAIRQAFPDRPFPPECAVPKFNDFSPERDVRQVLETMLEMTPR